MVTLRRTSSTALTVSSTEQALATRAPQRSLCDATLAAISSGDRTLMQVRDVAARRRDKVDGSAMAPAMITGMMAVMGGAPLIGIITDSVVAGVYAAVAAVRICRSLYLSLEQRDEAANRKGLSADAFDATLAQLDTSTPMARALAAEISAHIERGLNAHDIRGASLRDKLHVFIDDPRVSSDDRASARRIIVVLQQLQGSLTYLTDAGAIALLNCYNALAPHERDLVQPHAAKRLSELKRMPKGLSYQRFNELQVAFSTRPALSS